MSKLVQQKHYLLLIRSITQSHCISHSFWESHGFVLQSYTTCWAVLHEVQSRFESWIKWSCAVWKCGAFSVARCSEYCREALNADRARSHREAVSSPHTELHPHRLRGERQKRSSCLRSLKPSFLLSYSWMTAWGKLAGRGWKASVWGVSCYHQRCCNGVVIEVCTVEGSAYTKNN